jgi:hypothetical protein
VHIRVLGRTQPHLTRLRLALSGSDGLRGPEWLCADAQRHAIDRSDKSDSIAFECNLSPGRKSDACTYGPAQPSHVFRDFDKPG